MIATINGKQARVCHANCADGLRADRKHGVIHGPFRKADGSFYMNAEEASMAEGYCAYCYADVRMRRTKAKEKVNAL